MLKRGCENYLFEDYPFKSSIRAGNSTLAITGRKR
jgi:hypothetical protein